MSITGGERPVQKTWFEPDGEVGPKRPWTLWLSGPSRASRALNAGKMVGPTNFNPSDAFGVRF